MGDIIGCVVLSVAAVACFVLGCVQFKEKGYLFNNPYIFVSKQER